MSVANGAIADPPPGRAEALGQYTKRGMPTGQCSGSHVGMKQSRSARARRVQSRTPGVWKLTKAEARVVESLAQGRRPMDIAADLRLSVHTIRTQLKRAMAKAGVHAQSALVAMFYSAGNHED